MSLLRIESVTKTFAPRGGGEPVLAVDDVSIELSASETLALIGESGSGKSTLGRIALSLIRPDKGSVSFKDHDLLAMAPKELRRLRAEMTIVFQEPYESLNPRMRVGDIVAEPLVIHEPALTRPERRERVAAILRDVGLSVDHAERSPGVLSGGQQQRVGMARAMVTRPSLVVLDEPTSSLDLSIRAQILNLLGALQDKYGAAYLFISHDIATVAYINRRIAVMQQGRVVETGPTDRIMQSPTHPYTRTLLSAQLPVDPDESPPTYPRCGDAQTGAQASAS